MISWDRIVHSAALENNISDREAEKILNSSFRFLREVAFIEKKNMRFKNWGIFAFIDREAEPEKYKKYLARLEKFRQKNRERHDRLKADSGGVL
jgi:hypothetical protein